MRFLQLALPCLMLLVHGSAAGQTYCTFERDAVSVSATCRPSSQYYANFCATAAADSSLDTRNLTPMNAFRACASSSECPNDYSCITFQIPTVGSLDPPSATTSVCLPTSCAIQGDGDGYVSQATFDSCFLGAAGGDYSLSHFLGGDCDDDGSPNDAAACRDMSLNSATRNGCSGEPFTCRPTCDFAIDDERCPSCVACRPGGSPLCQNGCSKYCTVTIDASVAPVPVDASGAADSSVGRVDAITPIRPNVACKLVSAGSSPPIAFCDDVCGSDSCTSSIGGTCVTDAYPLVGSYGPCPDNTYAIPSLSTAGPPALCVPRSQLHCPGRPVPDGSLRTRVVNCYTAPETGHTASWLYGDCDADGIPNHCDSFTFTASSTDTLCSTIAFTCASTPEPQGCDLLMDAGVRDAGRDSGTTLITDASVPPTDSRAPRDAPGADSPVDSALARDAFVRVTDAGVSVTDAAAGGDAGVGQDAGTKLDAGRDANVRGPDADETEPQEQVEVITGGCSVGSRTSSGGDVSLMVLLLGSVIGLRSRTRKRAGAPTGLHACVLVAASLLWSSPAIAAPLDGGAGISVFDDAGFTIDAPCSFTGSPTVAVCTRYDAHTCSIVPTPGDTCPCVGTPGAWTGVCSPNGTCACFYDAGPADVSSTVSDAANNATYACTLRSSAGGLTMANLACQELTCLADGECRAPNSACRSNKYPLAVGRRTGTGLVCPEPGQIGQLTSLTFPEVLCLDPTPYVCPSAGVRTLSSELIALAIACHTSPSGMTPVLWERGDCDRDGTPNSCDPSTFVASSPTIVCSTPTPVPGASCVAYPVRCPAPTDAGAQDAQTADVSIPLDVITSDASQADAASFDSAAVTRDSGADGVVLTGDGSTSDVPKADAGVPVDARQTADSSVAPSTDSSVLDAVAQGADSAADPDGFLPDQPREIISGGCSVQHAADHRGRDSIAWLFGIASIIAAAFVRTSTRAKRRP